MRTTVMLRYFEDKTEPEIAATLGISLGTVKSTVSRAVAKLRMTRSSAKILAPEYQRPGAEACPSAGIQGLLPGARLVALSGMQVRHPEEVARCGAR